MRVTQYLLICVVIIAMLTSVVSAVQPEYNTITAVDGEPWEWFENDGVTLLTDNVCRDMRDGNTVYAQECIRYNCNTNTAYVGLFPPSGSGTRLLISNIASGFINNGLVYQGENSWDPLYLVSGPPFDWEWTEVDTYADAYEASFPLSPGTHSFYSQAEFLEGYDYLVVSTPPETLDVICSPVTAPEFPSAFLPVTMIIGFLGAVLYIQRTKEN
jgi:hypothetical protein